MSTMGLAWSKWPSRYRGRADKEEVTTPGAALLLCTVLATLRTEGQPRQSALEADGLGAKPNPFDGVRAVLICSGVALGEVTRELHLLIALERGGFAVVTRMGPPVVVPPLANKGITYPQHRCYYY